MDLAFEFRHYSAAFAIPIRTAHGDWLKREGVIIKVTDESGRTGYGEIAPIPWFGTESQDDAINLCRSLGSKVTSGSVEQIPDSMPCCRFAFGSAIESLAADPPVAAARTVARLLPAGADAIAVASRALADGFSCLKWKVGVHETQTEWKLLDELVSLMPADASLRLDANGAWNALTARKWASACRGKPVEFIEQPLPPGEDDALGALGADHPGLFALDESVTPPGALRRWLERGWPGVLVVKPSLGGDPVELRRTIDGSGADVVYSTAIETPVGWSAALRFALGDTRNKRALGFGAGSVFENEGFPTRLESPSLSTADLSVPFEETWKHLSN